MYLILLHSNQYSNCDNFFFFYITNMARSNMP